MLNAAAGTGFRCRGARGERRLAIHYVFVYVFCLQIVATTNDRMSSTLWKLNAEQGKIVSVPTGGGGGGSGRDDFTLDELAERLGEPDEDEESTFSIITATAANYRHNTWNRGEGTTEELLRRLAEGENPSSFGATSFNATAASPAVSNPQQPSRSGPSKPGDPSLDLLTCGKPVNFTHYDDLVGVAQRYEHNPAPEPEVAYLFLKRKTGQSLEHFNIDALERRLRRAKKEQPHTIALWNQIGNFWRIKGNAGHAIECFRRALSVAPTNADTLLNLARVLFNLQYLDDAISLTKRSLEVHPPDRSAWRQYFTLGEIFKAYGQLSDAILHLKQALALHPHYEPIRRLIAEAEKIEFASNTTRMQFYTGLIIAVLSLFVMLMVTVMLRTRASGHSHCGGGSSAAINITNISNNAGGYPDGGLGGGGDDGSDTNNNNNNNNNNNGLGPIINSFSLANFRPAKHFNRAQAMRSLRSVAFRSFRPFRYRK
uniref:UDP-N-acetylglucosamine--peptide N-acetylglucosaminyltransferase 110 kDa subunit n=1 Tax=Culex pipiens TaxID=7175 RepID=A0A8D8JGG0_CULPI